MKRMALTLSLAAALVVIASSSCQAGRLFRRGRAPQPARMVNYQPQPEFEAAPDEFAPATTPAELIAPQQRGPNREGYYGSPFMFPSWPYSHGPSYGGPYWGTFTDQPYFRFGPELHRQR